MRGQVIVYEVFKEHLSLSLSLLYYLYISPCQTLFVYFHAEGEGLAKEEMESSQYNVSNSLLALECGRKTFIHCPPTHPLPLSPSLHISLHHHPPPPSGHPSTPTIALTVIPCTSLMQLRHHSYPSHFTPLHPNLPQSHILSVFTSSLLTLTTHPLMPHLHPAPP